MGYRKIIFLSCILSVFYLSGYAQAPSCSAVAKFYGKDSINVTTFGASTVAGVGGFSFQPGLLNNIESCYTGVIVTVTKNGVSGETTTQGLVRFPSAIAGRTGFILILMGANDALAMADKKSKIGDTEANMRYYIETSIKNKLIPIIGTIQYFNDKNNQRLKTANLYVTQINTLYKRLAKEYNIYVADINRAIGRDFSLYQDYVHPNAEGYKLISFVWFDAINHAIEDRLLLVGLNQNYPNPAIDRTTIGFSLSQAGHVKIDLYNISGTFIKTLYDSYQNAGYQTINVPLNDLNAGIYIYTMQVGGQVISKKMIVTR
ncbi:T9SS type A sorting domain-containing protein [Mucilaginibacter corticis]|uniref:T9SS type A sorting domain-containing protein n=1 Tax=Mucilaginibacter corticis TaxID=2597670 RepID=A0A556MLJ1_9SPHI|nr:SGNH/GDSL hydrolase family protein [Mucilaginibacter corticis]TSJ40659.1 T9SS type A sorting domain-containing protein [Mucilaginibacter corticis]